MNYSPQYDRLQGKSALAPLFGAIYTTDGYALAKNGERTCLQNCWSVMTPDSNMICFAYGREFDQETKDWAKETFLTNIQYRLAAKAEEA
jgi:hypothetical protein